MHGQLGTASAMASEASKSTRVGWEVVHGVATLTLNHVERRNALSPEMAQELLEWISVVNDADDIGALVITGVGPAFCAGGDLSWIRSAMSNPLSPKAIREFEVVYALFSALSEARVPTLAAVGGAAIGAGINLAAACDVRVVADDFVARGFASANIHPGGGHLALLRKCVGPGTAAAIALFGRELNAHEAVRTGFAIESVKREELITRALEIAKPAGQNAALTRRTVATLRALQGFEMSVAGASLLERVGQAWSLQRLAEMQGTP